jgi:proteic killer suppression protein
MRDIFDVHLSKRALKDLKKVPLHIALKLQAWVDDVGHRGLSQVSKVSGYHDEPLKGKRVNQRSIRLSKAYRAIYIIEKDNKVKFVEVIEVNKHGY